MAKTGSDIMDFIGKRIKQMPAGTLIWLVIAMFMYLWLLVYNFKLWLLVNVGAVAIAFWQAVFKTAGPLDFSNITEGKYSETLQDIAKEVMPQPPQKVKATPIKPKE